MPTYLDFDSTKRFRDFMIGRTLQVPNGPQSFDSSNYAIKGTASFSNRDLGDVTTHREEYLEQPQKSNIFKPNGYYIIENLDVLPRRANLNLYPYFRYNDSDNLVSIFNSVSYENQSELMKFASYYIREDEDGPVHARVTQNLYSSTAGRLRFLDALENSTTAINIVTGREPLIELNNKITVAKTLPGKAIDFLQTVAGVEFPWTEIPGEYLSDPRNPINNRNVATTEAGRILQDVTGALGSLIGIQRRPKTERKPSDLFIEYMGEASKQRLYDNLSYSTYAPDYTTTARSQNSSKVFNFLDKAAEGIKNVLGLEAPKGYSYIGDDRGNDVKYAMNDFNDRPVRSPFYLSLFFDEVESRLFHTSSNITEGGSVATNLTWISSRSKNQTIDNSSDFLNTLSTKFTFRDDSILGKTQEILETLPSDGGEARSHVANVIDQTSRIFRDGDTMISRGSAIKYTDKYNGSESGVEYCRVWTKDNAYINNSALMKTQGNIRKFESSLLNSPYNINIYPNSKGDGTFDNSTNIVRGGDGFYAKKYMFSLENLAWKTSNIPGFTYNDLPYCERGNNGGRVMWFPPYDLKVTEQNSANWNENVFLGRPEPVYTYQNTQRNGTISFKVIVDHPSVLNLMVKKHFENMSEKEADNYINAFFAGCQEVDLYDLIRRYPTLTQQDVENILNYLNYGKDPATIERYRVEFGNVESENLPETTSTDNDYKTENRKTKNLKYVMFFDNDKPFTDGNPTELYPNTTFDVLTEKYLLEQENYATRLSDGIQSLSTKASQQIDIPYVKNDTLLLFNKEIIDSAEILSNEENLLSSLTEGFSKLAENYDNFVSNLDDFITKIENNTIKEIKITIISAASSVATTDYNLKLSSRRTNSIIKFVLSKLNKTGDLTTPPLSITNIVENNVTSVKFFDLGYQENDGQLIFSTESLGETLAFDLSENFNVDCSKSDYYTQELKTAAPVSFFCRQAVVRVDYIESTIVTKANTEKVVEVPKKLIVPESIPVSQKPPLDEVKRIVMKTLSECYYFKQMEEDTPSVFNSLKEKFKYFHPAFHSMTPEGLNTRLTFLQQCIRPGDTIPIKGITEENDLNARNTTFGPPPICVIRVGDFFHSKIIIRDVNISYEDSTWDLNPEGIGIQPMIADVSLQISFIGGHGLEKPVERLQNALSSNFYANTEMYDYRSTATEDRTEFNKEFLEQFISMLPKELIPETNTNSANNISDGNYIGAVTSNKLSYTDLINEIYDLTKEYFTNYSNALNLIINKYGKKFGAVYFSTLYRTVNTYTVQTGGLNQVINLLGEYPKFKGLSYYLDNFKSLVLAKIDTSIDIATLIGFNTKLNQSGIDKCNNAIKPWLKKKMGEFIDDMYGNVTVNNAVYSRNRLTSQLDKLNFIVQTSYDGKILTDEVVAGELSGFTPTTFYSKYKPCIDYIISNNNILTQSVVNTFDFTKNNTSITNSDFSEFLILFLKENSVDFLKALSDYDDTYFTEDTISILETVLNTFAGISNYSSTLSISPLSISPLLGTFPNPIDSNLVSFSFTEKNDIFTDSEINDLNKINSTKVELGTTLNFYKP